MKKKNFSLVKASTEAGDVINILLKEKFLILFIVIICTLFSYQNENKKVIKYKTKVEIINLTSKTLEDYSNIINSENVLRSNVENKLNDKFISNLHYKLRSRHNLNEFIKQSKEIDDSKDFFNARNTTALKYLSDNFSFSKEDNTYFLVHEPQFNGEAFLKNYLQFTKKVGTIEILEDLKVKISSVISIYEDALKISKKLNIINPTQLARPYVNNNFALNFERNNELYNLGSQVIESKIKSFKELIAQSEDIEKININLRSQVSEPELISRSESLLLNTIGGSILGFFLSLLIIYFKKLY